MRYLYYCNSAYQLMTILNLHYQRKENKFENIDNYNADIIVSNAFYGAEKIVKKIESINFFNSVFLIDKKDDSIKLRFFGVFLNLLFPITYIRKFQNLDSIVKNKYDVIVVPKFSKITASIWQINREAELHLYEDGISTYYLDIILQTRSIIFNKMYKVLNGGKDFHNYKALYLNNADLFCGKTDANIIQIARIDKKVREMIVKMMDCKMDIKYSYFWFDQYLTDANGLSACKIAIEKIKRIKRKVLFCPHPRYPKEDISFDIKPKEMMWEFSIVNNNINNKCLLSFDSTACIAPKVLFNYEPYIIFVYSMYDKDDKKDEFMKKFIDSYENREKIMIPKNEKEFDQYLIKLEKEFNK